MLEEHFNAAAYAADNPEAMAMGFDPWIHFINYGGDPNAKFNENYFKPSTSVSVGSLENFVPVGFGESTTYSEYGPVSSYAGYNYKDPNTGNLYDSNGKLISSNSIQDTIQGTVAANDPEKLQKLYDLKSSNPNEYYKQVADILQDRINYGYGANENISSFVNQLENIKQENPAAYYENKLKGLGYQAGWQTGQNTDPSGAYKQIQALLPEAQKAGLSIDQINSLVGTSANNANAQNQSRIANEAANGNWWTENLIGALKVGALSLGAYGLDTALTAGAAAAGSAGGAGGMDAAATSYLGSAPGAFVPAEGFSATLPSAIGAGSAGGTYVTPELMGPTYAEMGFTGLNQGEAIAAADAASKGLTLSEIASAANKAKQVYGAGSTIAKLLGGTGATGATSGINQNQLANLLKGLGSSNQTSSYLGQIKANQNPFTWASPGQTAAAPGTYDVSGSNMANALRKA